MADSPDLSHIDPQLRTLAVRVDSLVADPKNARAHGRQNREAVLTSLRENGQYMPLLVQEEGRIVVVGNNRLLAMRELGWTWCAANIVPLTQVEAVRRAIVDNRAGELAEWDYGQLTQNLALLDEDLRLGLGFNGDELGALLATSNWDAEVHEVPEPLEPGEQPGHVEGVKLTLHVLDTTQYTAFRKELADFLARFNGAVRVA